MPIGLILRLCTSPRHAHSISLTFPEASARLPYREAPVQVTDLSWLLRLMRYRGQDLGQWLRSTHCGFCSHRRGLAAHSMCSPA